MLNSCSLDINENPNYPSNSDVTPDLIFPAIENSIAAQIGDEMITYGGFFSQYFEQSPSMNQYNDLAELHIDENSNPFDRIYRNLYSQALLDIKDLQGKVTSSSDLFALQVLRTNCFQLIVDNIDQAPYEEALMGSEIPSPKFDDGATIYQGVLKELDEAQSKLDGSLMTMTDPMLGKNVAQWKGFANALRLRMYMRLIDGGINASEYTAKAKALVSAGEFFTGDVTWDVYQDSETEWNPWFAGYNSLGQNYCAAFPIVSYMDAMDDARISAYLKVRAKDNTYMGQAPGAKTVTYQWVGLTKNGDYNMSYVSLIKADATRAMPIYLFTQSELQFLIAEVEYRFNGDAAAAKAAYEAAVTSDFTSRQIAGSADFLAAKGSWDKASDKLNLLYMQKWVALFMRNHMEAWSEIRRTDVPALSTVSGKEAYTGSLDYVKGQLLEPTVNYINGGGLAKRLPFPSTARKYNTNTPSAKLISDRVFWDAK